MCAQGVAYYVPIFSTSSFYLPVTRTLAAFDPGLALLRFHDSLPAENGLSTLMTRLALSTGDGFLRFLLHSFAVFLYLLCQSHFVLLVRRTVHPEFLPRDSRAFFLLLMRVFRSAEKQRISTKSICTNFALLRMRIRHEMHALVCYSVP